jgi:hypothetical protein
MNSAGQWPKMEPVNWRPFHLINITLNLVSSNRLAWQERMAAPFSVSPLHCGTGINLDTTTMGAYRLSSEYGDAEPPGGISLGTAMAISGAAASPNMGYHSSPAFTLLMTLFNVRLGWWLGNPGQRGELSYKEDGPTMAIFPLLQETFGYTTADRKYVYLSDGGHFENLGLYEMVRRRCRYIVLIDASRDPKFTFEALGNAARKIMIDLGVSVRFVSLGGLKKRPTDGSDLGEDVDYHVMGEIDYPAADGGGERGKILYIKPGYHAVESAGIRSYAAANPDFPHETTSDQWFTESQFESYRALGFEIMDGVLKKAQQLPGYAETPTLSRLFEALEQRIRAVKNLVE